MHNAPCPFSTDMFRIYRAEPGRFPAPVISAMPRPAALSM
jgi:hypothetical protein